MLCILPRCRGGQPQVSAVIGRFLLLAGAASMIPVAQGYAAATAQSGDAAASRFAPPATPMVLTRTVWRSLGDGNQIVVTRRYAVSFSARGEGFVLDGYLLDAAVSAPAPLQAMADVERRRTDHGMFPIELDSRGWIKPRPGPAINDAAARQAALDNGRSIIATAQIAAERRIEGVALFAQLAAQGIGAAWPSDLFNPREAQSHENRRVALPDGQEGEVNVSIKVGVLHPCGLPQAVERTVITRLAETERVSREQWTLAVAATESP